MLLSECDVSTSIVIQSTKPILKEKSYETVTIDEHFLCVMVLLVPHTCRSGISITLVI